MQTEKEIRENLLDAGVDDKEAESILRSILSGDLRTAEKLISASRKRELQKIHESQQCIDKLDYLCWQMKK